MPPIASCAACARTAREFPVEVGLSRLPAIGGRGKCVCASVRDITARKEAEDRLAMAEERSRLILGAVGDGIVGLDTDGYHHLCQSGCPGHARLPGR